MNENALSKLLTEMTIEEKVGQCVQLSGDYYEVSGEITGPKSNEDVSETQINNVGSVLGVFGSDVCRKIQKSHLENSRLSIPLLFMADIVHGCNTIFPVPIGLGSSFNPSLAYESSKVAAYEGRQQGIHVTFAPMLDLAVDARWGRNMETSSEDPKLNAVFAKEYVHGFQQDGLNNKNTMASCIKHFAAYGMVQAGREYNTVDLSRRFLMQSHLPSYQSGVDAGAKMAMTAFNTYDSRPCTGNKSLLDDLLRKQMGFDGVIISDWGAVKELINHQVAADNYDASVQSFNATCDIDMMSNCYNTELIDAVKNGGVDEALLDEAVMRILKLKAELGLFEDPYNQINDEVALLSSESKEVALQAAQESIVLLKNEQVLPLRDNRVALFGPMSNSGDLMGPWSWHGNENDVETNKHCFIRNDEKIKFVEYSPAFNISAFKDVDTVIFSGGENSFESGESNSKVDINLNQSQIDTIKKLKQIGKKIIFINYSGRPTVLTEVEPYCDAIIQAWFPGTMASQALYNIIFGKYNPSARLSMTFPRHGGQCPISYLEYQTGRPKEQGVDDYVSKYIDCENTPLYKFGHGLNYNNSEITNINYSSDYISEKENIKIDVDITNNSEFSGDEVLMVFINDVVSGLIRPMKELIHFDKFMVEDKHTYSFEITLDDLKYVDQDNNRLIEPGVVELFIGLDSNNLVQKNIEVR